MPWKGTEGHMCESAHGPYSSGISSKGFRRWTFAMSQSSLSWPLFWLMDESMWLLCLLHMSLSTLGLILMKYMPNHTEIGSSSSKGTRGQSSAVYVPNTSSGQICLLILYPQIHWECRWIETAWLWLLPGLGNLYHCSKMVICVAWCK